MKKRFAIMRKPLEIGNFHDLCQVYYTCVAIHNFIRVEKQSDGTIDREFEAEVQREMQQADNCAADEGVLYSVYDDDGEYIGWRDNIASAMWADYQHYLAE